MTIRRLDHINFITNNMPATIAFYTKIIGLVHGDNLAGAAEGMEYIYLPGQNIAVLHIGDAQVIRNSPKFRQVAKIENNLLNTGVIDHFCLQLDFEDYEIMLSRLNNNKITYEKYEHSTGWLNQIWILDPNNIRVELNFCK
jgi:catechol 2,3-dioxygenase-like lactoylglutathione lyase family enzyme